MHIVVEEDLSDPFFTPEEWEKVQKARKTILDKFIEERYSSPSEKSAKRICIDGEQSIEEELKTYVETCVCGETSMFIVWPDFNMLQHYSRAERRLGKDVFKHCRVRGVGEIQSAIII